MADKFVLQKLVEELNKFIYIYIKVTTKSYKVTIENQKGPKMVRNGKTGLFFARRANKKTLA